jgi:hypothetical protein
MTKFGVILAAAVVAATGFAFAADAPATSAPATPAAEIKKAPGFPEKYKGTPYKGVAQEIPGRVELENFDDGGLNVGFNTNHHDEDQASGKAYRPKPWPNICITNAPKDGPDKFMDGKRYPWEDTSKEGYYIGYTRPGDWVKCTVNVKKAGVYKVSSTFASDPDKFSFSLSFNDGKPVEVKGEGTKSYHKWKVFDNLTSVKLEEGLNVMLFKVNIEHLNYDYLEFTFDEKATAEAAK